MQQVSVSAGEDQEGIKPKIKMLHKNGIGGILDYAAEDDMDADEGPASRTGPHEKVVARTFDYGSEEVCDGHMRVFMKSIEAAADAPGRGFAAIKVRQQRSSAWQNAVVCQSAPVRRSDDMPSNCAGRGSLHAASCVAPGP